MTDLFDRTFSRLTAAALVCAGLATASEADAAATGTLTFLQQAGTVTTTASIPVFLRLTLSAGSDTIATDDDGQLLSPLFTEQQIRSFSSGGPNPVFGDPNQPYQTNLNNAFRCSGTFTTTCTTGPAYDFQFNFGATSLVGPRNFTLAAGQSYDFLFGTFVPTGGNAAPGLYTFYNAIVLLQFSQTIDGQNIFGSVNVAETCPTETANCAFTRLVTPAAAGVPEPATWLAMTLGLGLVGGSLRARRRRSPLRAAA